MSFEDDKLEIMKIIAECADGFIKGLFTISLQKAWSFDKTEEVMQVMDIFFNNQNDYSFDDMKNCFSAVGIYLKDISDLFQLCRQYDRYKSITTKFPHI